MPTLGRILGAVRHRLAGVGVYEDDSCELMQPLSESGLVLQVDSVQGVTRGVFEVGLELLRVKAVDVASSTITLPTFGRGYKGTTVSAHPAGSEVVANPMWPASVVAAEVNGVLNELYPSLYAVRSFEAVLVAGVPFTVPAECTGIIAVFVSYDTADGWVRQDSWRWEPDAGQGLRVDHARPGAVVRVVYAARPGTFVLDEGQRVRRNLVRDPRGTNPALWRTSPGDSLTPVTDSGFPALETTQVTGAPVYADPVDNFPVAVGDVVRCSVEVKALTPAVAAAMRLTLSGYAGAGFATGTSAPLVSAVPVGEWVRIEVSAAVTAAPLGAYVRCLLWPVGTMPDGEAFRHRGWVVEVGPNVVADGTYWDGSSSITGLATSWDGTPNASISTAVPTKSVLDADFRVTTGLDDRAVDLLALGVAYRLAPFADMARLSATSAEPRNDPQSKPPQSGAQASRLLLAEFTQRLQQEQAVLHKEHPIRVHRVKR